MQLKKQLDVDPNDEKSAWKKAINLLSRRAYFSAELGDKLKKVGYSATVIQAVIEKCRQAGYLDDKERTRCMMSVWEKKGYGPARIRLELQRRGIKTSFPITTDPQYLSRYISKHLPEDATVQQKNKIIRALLRRGFSLEVILQECSR